ncbi:hypothetical protein GH714_020484 [Hevea brasiliensis]|uniref:Uncharacterized protein n=1 Tax=Hevea brasiliensis TaxID=3981 RepID=A0A6A6K6E1_HEVBR|nr:hypothetical protein GH714_020484 [Hevea brasiliensis]
MMIMAELQSLYRIHKVLTDSEMVAAQQLMQLSDEDNSNSINRKSKNKNNCDDNEDSFDRSSQDEITSKKKIEEILVKKRSYYRTAKEEKIQVSAEHLQGHQADKVVLSARPDLNHG